MNILKDMNKDINIDSLYICGEGNVLKTPHVQKNRCFPFSVVVSVLQGSYFVQIDKVYRMNAGQAIVIPENIVHHIWMEEIGFIHWAHISYHWLGRDVLSFEQYPILFEGKEVEILGTLCSLLANHNLETSDFDKKLEQTIERNILMLKLLQEIRKKSNPRVDHKTYHLELYDVLNYIHKNLDKNIRLNELADITLLSEGAFSHKFKRLINMSPIEFVINEKMKYACRLLSVGKTSVGEAASAVGYNDPLYFSKLFKRYIGMSPRNYKDMIQKQMP